MSYDLESNAGTFGDGPEIAAMKDSASDVAPGELGAGEGITYPTVSVRFSRRNSGSGISFRQVCMSLR